MQDKFNRLIEKINNLSMRERVMVLLACLVVLQQAWDSLVWRPMDERQTQLLSQETQINEQLLKLEVDLKILTAQASRDPDLETKNQIEGIQNQLSAVNLQIEKSSSSLVSPAEMAKLLEQLLVSEKGLQLINLETLDSVALIPVEDKALTRNHYQIYRHAFSIEFAGSYLATLRYIQALEKLPWTFFWDGIDYQVDTYPQSRVRLKLYTLSLSEGWIGV